MLARCTHCQNTFVTQQFGRQQCPKCGTEVMIEDPRPGAYTPPTTPLEPAPEPLPSTGQLTPWERRDELGFFPALTKTIGGAISNPGPFFTGMRYDVENGGLLFYLLVGAIPILINQLISWAATDPEQLRKSVEDIKPVMENLDANTRHAVETFLTYAAQQRSDSGLVLSIIQSTVGSVLFLFIFAGIPHVILAIFGFAPRGWTASFKASTYATTPMLFMVIPVCGGLIGLSWATCLQIYGLSKAHSISYGKASIGVLGLHAVALTCCCGAAALVAFAAIGAGAHP